MPIGMHDPEQVRAQLDAIAANPDFAHASDSLVSGWTADDVGACAVDPVLRFMEEHPAIDFGAPGPLVHFLERFWKQGYEEALLVSVRRCPTPHTIWMLNRVINGEESPAVRAKYLSVMGKIAQSRATDDAVRGLAAEFLVRLKRS